MISIRTSSCEVKDATTKNRDDGDRIQGFVADTKSAVIKTTLIEKKKTIKTPNVTLVQFDQKKQKSDRKTPNVTLVQFDQKKQKNSQCNPPNNH